MRYSGFQRLGFACLMAAALAGCGSSEARRGDAGALPLETPPDPAGARLVYQRPTAFFCVCWGRESPGGWRPREPGRAGRRTAGPLSFWRGNRILRLDLESGEEVTVAEMKDPRERWRFIPTGAGRCWWRKDGR